MLKRLFITLLLLIMTPTLAPCGQRYIRFDAQVGAWTATNTIASATSLVDAVIKDDYDAGTTGVLELIRISNAGALQDNEVLYESALGAEHLTTYNRGFEDAGGGGDDIFAVWSDQKTDGLIVDETVLVYAGENACKIIQGAGTNSHTYRTVAGFTIGLFYEWSVWTRGDGSKAGRWSAGGFGLSTTDTGVPGTVYDQIFHRGISTATSVSIYLQGGSAEADIAYFDDNSVKPITNAALSNGTAYGGGRASW